MLRHFVYGGDDSVKRIVLLGASGSIGTQTIDVVTHHSDCFCICALSVGHNLAQLEKLLAQLPQVRKVCVAEEQDHERLSRKYPQLDWYWGEEGLLTLAAWSEYDLLVNAVVGFRGLHPTLCAISHRHDVALANKESLVAGGELVKAALREHGVNLYPIDSEHSAIFQCLRGNDPKEVRRLIITASGGSFRDRTREELTAVSVKEALHHPNWNMGGRITIDSATMMNKGFEVIEAHHLFELPYEQIDVLIHRESVIHSMVEYQDHAIIAQLGSADMRVPIQYALSYPHRLVMEQAKPFDFMNYPQLHFEAASFARWPLLAAAYDTGKKGGNLGAVMNGADEMAVELFLKGAIGFLDIEHSVIDALAQADFVPDPDYAVLEKSDAWARAFVREKWKGAF